MADTYSAQRQFLVTVSGIVGTWMTKGGGGIQADSNKIFDGGSLRPSIITSPPTTEDVVISRAYKQSRDESILQNLRGKVGRYTTTITVQPTDQDLIAVGRPTVYADAVLVGLTEPELNSDSGDVANFELTFSVVAPTN